MIRIQRDSVIRYSAIILAALGIYSLSITIGTTGLTFQLIIIVLALSAGFVTIVLPRGVEWGYLIWIGMFALGYRTTRLFTYLSLHPLTIEIFLLAGVLLLKQSSNKEKQTPIRWGIHSVGVVIFLF